MTPLHTEVLSAGPGTDAGPATALVLAHGFTQTGRLWGGFKEVLAPHHRLIGVDLPGHAGSSDVRADVPESADLLVASIPDDGPIDLLGYSLGARVALHAALRHPGRVRRLVLIGGTAGIEGEAARRERVARDEALADELESSGDLSGFLSRWLAGPLFFGLADPGTDERLRNTPEGLASSLRLAGAATTAPVWDRLGEIEIPLLALAGADDARFTSAALRLARSAAHGVCSVVPGAGHATHLAQPAVTATIVAGFLGAH